MLQTLLLADTSQVQSPFNLKTAVQKSIMAVQCKFHFIFKDETASMQRHVLWALYVLKNNNEETTVEAS